MRFAPILVFLALLVGACTKPSCNLPNLDYSKLKSLKKAAFSEGPIGGLVLPNPIEATRNIAATATSADTLGALFGYNLPGLLSPQRLENEFLKIRIREIQDSLTSLAKPDSSGRYLFGVSDAHYSEVLAYHSVETMKRYVEALGFPIVKTRPLYVLVRAKGSTANSADANAVYDHGYLDPSAPRTMSFFGEGAFAPGEDRDIFWHEFGHLFNESVSAEVGIDSAGDNRADFTQGSALHECLADYLAETVSNKPYLGKWLARNFPEIPQGQPLRSAVDTGGRALTYDSVSLNRGGSPEKYLVAEWCTRVLWDVRTALQKKYDDKGPELSDRLVYSAVSLLTKDTSMRQFRDKLVEADQKLYCGENQDSIAQAFSSRGFEDTPKPATSPLRLVANAVRSSDGVLAFQMTLTNPNQVTVRDVRVRLEALGGGITPLAYMQGYGDIPAGGVVNIVPDLSVNAGIGATGNGIRYRLHVTSENAPETVLSSEVAP